MPQTRPNEPPPLPMVDNLCYQVQLPLRLLAHSCIWHTFSVGLRFVENHTKFTNLRPDNTPVPSPLKSLQLLLSSSVALSLYVRCLLVHIWHTFSVGLRFVENHTKFTNLRPDNTPVPSPLKSLQFVLLSSIPLSLLPGVL